MEHELRQPWAERWQTARTRWDQGKEHPLLNELLTLAEIQGQLKSGTTIYSSGCGRAHSEAAMAKRGYQVLACDFVPEAVSAARDLYQDVPNLRIEERDALEVADDERGAFHAIYDRAMLCALQPKNRAAYIDACWQRLMPRGLFMGILFTETTHGPEVGPPFAIPVEQLMVLFKDKFTLVAMETRSQHLATDDVIREESLCVWMRRESGS